MLAAATRPHPSSRTNRARLPSPPCSSTRDDHSRRPDTARPRGGLARRRARPHAPDDATPKPQGDELAQRAFCPADPGCRERGRDRGAEERGHETKPRGGEAGAGCVAQGGGGVEEEGCVDGGGDGGRR
ncbi:hypothetical protein EYC84_003001 [Monilinia fructicola]|uniref:Uncharacterized protein n=1 Tax=Monilinia fructicola TaxID=38448 RepID=A0A5M9JWA6_MONFR|nr:hypothetical protein EYC84_003001 [Monilinia fructicola]